MTLHIDIETYGPADLPKVGVDVYAETAEITLFGYAFDDEPVSVIDVLSGERLPREVYDAFDDPTILLAAHNAAFERVMIDAHFGCAGDPERWYCTAVHAAFAGHPRSLKGAAEALLPPDVRKDAAGTALINYFAKPCRPTKVNGGRTRNLPEHAPGRWADFMDYCQRDVEVEREVARVLADRAPIPPDELRLWRACERVNDRGVRVDLDFCEAAVARFGEVEREASARMSELIDNPSARSLPSILAALKAEGCRLPDLRKETVSAALDRDDLKPTAREVLTLRQTLSKTSVAKFHAALRSTSRDRRARGVHVHYGARTGRWAGRRIQTQNLPRGLGVEAVRAVRARVREATPAELSQALRSIIAGPVTVCDYSAVEARVLAWLAGERWQLDVFRGDGKIYEATGAQMFGVPVERITKGSDLRHKAKAASLGCGYGGGWRALETMGGRSLGLDEDDMRALVAQWRAANRNIVAFWDALDRAFKEVTRGSMLEVAVGPQDLLFDRTPQGDVRVALPSGRRLYYPDARLEPGRFGMDIVVGDGERTYGGKIAENVTQAVARDLLADALMQCDEAKLPVVLHVHDEIVLDGDHLSAIEGIMSTPPAWASDLPLACEGQVAPFFTK